MANDMKDLIPKNLTPLGAATSVIAIVNYSTSKIDAACQQIGLVWWLAGFVILITIVSLLIFFGASLSDESKETEKPPIFPSLQSFVGVLLSVSLPWFVSGLCCVATIGSPYNFALTGLTLMYAFMVICCELLGLASVCRYTHVRNS